MDAFELLRNWPTWSKANAKTIFGSPAWRMPVSFDGKEAALTHLPDAPSDELLIDLSLDDEPVVLGLVDSQLFPDLHLVWPHRAGLPSELLLALVERECGTVFQMIEDAFRKLVTVRGVHVGAPDGTPRARLALSDDGGRILDFSISLKSGIAVAFGHLEYLDVNSPAIRDMRRPAVAEYATLGLGEAELAALAADDRLLVESGLGVGSAHWLLELPDDDALRICDQKQGELSFAQLADDALPPVPPPAELAIYFHGHLLATAKSARVGEASAVRLLSLHPNP